jgi:hypothetical protein
MPHFSFRSPEVVMSHTAILVTNCTNRKRIRGKVLRLGASGLKGTVADVARRWAEAVASATQVYAAQHVYVGRSIAEAKNAAQFVNGELYVVSAGLGLVHSVELIPAYDLTVSAGTGSVAPLLNRERKSAADWWETLTSVLGPHRSVRRLVEANKKATILFALPAGYLALISRDLGGLTATQASRIRIVTSSLGAASVPDHLQRYVLPYDERLEGSAYAGTRVDFPQRALRHFIEQVGCDLSLEQAHAQVKAAMEALMKPVLPLRAKKSDDEILAVLRKHWDQYEGRSGRLLRFLRDDALVACEQSRFRGLWLRVQDELRD